VIFVRWQYKQHKRNAFSLHRKRGRGTEIIANNPGSKKRISLSPSKKLKVDPIRDALL